MAETPMRFLIVEDDDDHAELIRLALEESETHTQIERVRDGVEALACLHREGIYADRARPHALLLDLKMPRVDGHEVLELVKADPVLRRIPVVVLTTSPAEADKARAYHNHANSYLVKPIDSERFVELIRDLEAYWGQWNQRSAGRLMVLLGKNRPSGVGFEVPLSTAGRRDSVSCRLEAACTGNPAGWMYSKSTREAQAQVPPPDAVQCWHNRVPFRMDPIPHPPWPMYTSVGAVGRVVHV